MKKNYRSRLLYVTQAGIIAALYFVFSYIPIFPIHLFELRAGEALCILPFFFPAAIPGLTIGCVLTNWLHAMPWQDVVFGSLATLIGALGAYLLRKISPWLIPIPTVLANALILPPVFILAYGDESALWFLILQVGGGEILSAYILGMVLLFALRRVPERLFRPQT